MRVASDIGGTFTDLAYLDETTGEVGTTKVATTPARPEVVAAMTNTGDAADRARAFIDYLGGNGSRAVFARHGFYHARVARTRRGISSDHPNQRSNHGI